MAAAAAAAAGGDGDGGDGGEEGEEEERVSASEQLAAEVEAPLGRLRGRVHEFGPRQIPFLATYHPAYLLRKPADKRKSWEDLKRIREVLAG